MGHVGLAALDSDDEQPFLGYELAQGHHYSEVMAARVDEEVETQLAECYNYAKQLLSEHRDQLDRLVAALLQDDTVDQVQLTAILGPRPLAGPEPCGDRDLDHPRPHFIPGMNWAKPNNGWPRAKEALPVKAVLVAGEVGASQE
jgi:hypothetical protein